MFLKNLQYKTLDDLECGSVACLAFSSERHWGLITENNGTKGFLSLDLSSKEGMGSKIGFDARDLQHTKLLHFPNASFVANFDLETLDFLYSGVGTLCVSRDKTLFATGNKFSLIYFNVSTGLRETVMTTEVVHFAKWCIMVEDVKGDMQKLFEK